MSMTQPAPAPVEVSTVAGVTSYTCTYCEEEITSNEAQTLILEQEKKDRDAQVMTPERVRNHAVTQGFLTSLAEGLQKAIATAYSTTPDINQGRPKR
jgi:hypothetical protein